jgi:cellulose synthase/poly-beta-1,6-N-acetylglucosamine synthase-like glycosyltransferase
MNLTIGVCAFNEGRNIKTLLNDILSQEGLPGTSSVIVVASGCTDDTTGVVREVMRDNPKIRLIEEENRSGKATAINRILAMRPGGLVMLVDADTRVPRNSVMEVVREFSDEKIGVVGALPIVDNTDSGAVAKSAAIIWRVMTQAMSELSPRDELSFVMGELYCFRTSILQSIPADIVNDDAYIATFARSKGFKVVIAPQARFVTKVPSSIPDYLAQRRRVIFGHRLIKARTGRYATSMEGIALNHTWALVRATIREAASHPTSIIRALLILELEAIAGLLAWLDRKNGKQHVLWKRVETTKRSATS